MAEELRSVDAVQRVPGGGPVQIVVDHHVETPTAKPRGRHGRPPSCRGLVIQFPSLSSSTSLSDLPFVKFKGFSPMQIPPYNGIQLWSNGNVIVSTVRSIWILAQYPCIATGEQKLNNSLLKLK